MSRITRALVLSISLLVTSFYIVADDYHYINLFVGDRASGLGGAYSAISDGPEGAYYNPAGLAFSPSVYVSVSNNAVQLKTFRYKDIWAGISAEPVNYTRNSFSYVPNFFGTVQRNGTSGFALTLANTENDSFDQRDRILLYEPSLSANQVVDVGFVQSNSTQELGLSWGAMLGDQFALGWGGFLGYRESKTISENIQQVEGYAFFQTQTGYYRRQKVSFRPSLGVQWIPSKTLSVGLSATASVPLLAFDNSKTVLMMMVADGWSGGSELLDSNLAIVNNANIVRNIAANGLFASTYAQANLGAAYFLSSSFLVSADGSIYVPINSSSDTLQRALTWNAALGMEWYLSPNFPLRLGLYTNNANTPEIAVGTLDAQDHMDLYGGSVSVGYATNNFDLTLGLNGSLGWGKAQILTGSTNIQDMDGSSLQIFISGSFH